MITKLRYFHFMLFFKKLYQHRKRCVYRVCLSDVFPVSFFLLFFFSFFSMNISLFNSILSRSFSSSSSSSNKVKSNISLEVLLAYMSEYQILGLKEKDIQQLYLIFRQIIQTTSISTSFPSSSSSFPPPPPPPLSSSSSSIPLNNNNNSLITPTTSESNSNSNSNSNPNNQTNSNEITSISLDKLIKHLDIEKTSFISLIFMSFDVDLFILDDIDFPRFLQAIWNYCTLNDQTLSNFTFFFSLSFIYPLLKSF